MNGANAGAGSFGALLRRHRGAMGLTQEELAARAGLHAQEISKLERGVLRSPHSRTVEYLARALKLDPEQEQCFIVAARSQLRPMTRGGTDAADDGVIRAGSGETAAPVTGRIRHHRRAFVRPLLGLLAVLLLVGLTIVGAWRWLPAASPAASAAPPSQPRCTTAVSRQSCWANVTSAGGSQRGPCDGQVPLYLRGGGHLCL